MRLVEERVRGKLYVTELVEQTRMVEFYVEGELIGSMDAVEFLDTLARYDNETYIHNVNGTLFIYSNVIINKILRQKEKINKCLSPKF